MREKTNTDYGSPWLFFSLAFILTWGFWIPVGFLSPDKFGVLPSLLHYAGGAMPMLVTLLLLWRCGTAEGRKDFWRRLVDVRRIQGRWWMVIFLTVPLLTGIGTLLGGEGTSFEVLSGFLNKPLSIVPFAVFLLLFGPVPEEMAWRGYAQLGLQKKYDPLTASVILGVLWTIWHLPLFFIQGSYQYGLGMGTPQFWLFLLDKIPMSIVIGWVFNQTRNSTLSAVVLHFMINFVGELLDLSLQGSVVYILSWWILAVIVALLWKPQNISSAASST